LVVARTRFSFCVEDVVNAIQEASGREIGEPAVHVRFGGAIGPWVREFIDNLFDATAREMMLCQNITDDS
jgi:hypothetical protein